MMKPDEKMLSMMMLHTLRSDIKMLAKSLDGFADREETVDSATAYRICAGHVRALIGEDPVQPIA